MSELAIIVAVARDWAIGKDNKMPWHIPADLKHFKAVTMGSPVIMGRRTFESIGRPLPGRRNIVISTSAAIDGVEVVGSLEDALKAVANEKEAFIIGGGNLYRQTLPLVSKLYLTVVDGEYEADTYFPAVDMTQWREVSSVAGSDNGYTFTFKEFAKIPKLIS